MSTSDLDVRRANADSIDRVVAVLSDANLPHADVRTDPSRFFLAYADATLVGVGGLERHDRHGLIRSIAVLPDHRGRGHGTAICAHLEASARDAGVETLSLLTTTAGEFFRARGYGEVDRQTVPASIRATREFSDLCPDSATCLRKSL